MMRINANTVNSSSQTNLKALEKPEEKRAKKEETVAEHQDQYIPGTEEEKKVTYDRPKVDRATIQRLKAESDKAYSSLRQLVEQLLQRQGMTFQDLALGKELEVDEAARVEAQALIGEGGELSPEKVSERIVEFAKAISGGDKGKFEELKSAIEEGFAQAAAVLGGQLPEISQKTYDLVMEKLNQWLEEE